MITDQGIAVPDDMAAALRNNPDAWAVFCAMRPARQREYVDWVGRSTSADQRGERLERIAAHVLADRAAAEDRPGHENPAGPGGAHQ